ncbi:MAG TPA: hypothetical protein PK413_10835 [Thermoanaerobaculia bacterium]|nr:hypothetical protein [Thermoanaerobaculia bacterium]
MTRTPTHQDAELITRLYDLRREARMREAREWFAGSFAPRTLEDFDRLCPRGSKDNASFRMVIGYWNMVASFITNEVLHPELFFETGQELLLTWEKVKPIVPAFRERAANPFAFRSLEKVATAYIEWYEARAPEFYPRFAAGVASLAPPSEAKP